MYEDNAIQLRYGVLDGVVLTRVNLRKTLRLKWMNSIAQRRNIRDNKGPVNGTRRKLQKVRKNRCFLVSDTGIELAEMNAVYGKTMLLKFDLSVSWRSNPN